MYRRSEIIIKKLLPKAVSNFLFGQWDRNGLKKYVRNTGWLFFGRIASFVISFLTITFVARYLGPENLGKLSYAQSFVAIFSMFASLGIDQIVYRDLVAKPEREAEILGTAFIVKALFGTLTLFVTVATAFFINTEPLLTWLIALIALSFIFQPLGTVGHVFSARVLSKYPTLVGFGVSLLIPLLKLLVIFFDKGILYFAAIITLEAFLLGLMYIFLYHAILKGSVFNWRVRAGMCRSLIRDSWPLMLVGVTGYLYARIDQVMIQHFLDSTAVGLYEAAVRLTEPLGFIPGILIGSLFPALINARLRDRIEYRNRFRSLIVICLGTSSALALFVFIFAPTIVQILYGPEYSPSVAILKVYVWSTLGTIATALLYNYLTIENRALTQLAYTASGATLNITLNAYLIPSLGAIGAAIATLITLMSILIFFFVYREIQTRLLHR